MSKTDDMVVFLMPDGTKVSNDPGFGLREALHEQLDATENMGDVGIHPEDQKAQTQVEHMASMNSAQPGVGENPAPDDPTTDLHGPLGSPAMQRQVDDAMKAKEAGADPSSTSVDDAEPVDSNQAVFDQRAKRQAAAEKAQEALEEAGEDPGDPEQEYSEWSAKQLKAEVAKRNAQADRPEEYQIKFEGKATKATVAEALDADDARQAGQVPAE